MQNRIGKLLRLATGAFVLAYLSGCASPLRDATDQFRAGSYSSSLEALEKKSEKIADRDMLLLKLNRGLILHQMGRFKDSNIELLKAAEIIEELSRTSISEQVSTLAVNEWLASYRGEYSEQLWVHSYMMMNFLLMGDAESAAVEARRALKVFDEQPDSLKQAFFSRALVATSFENAGLINDAYIEYKLLAENSFDNASIADKLYQQSLQLGLTEDAERYRKELFGGIETPPKTSVADGELIVFLSQGDIPYKVSGNVFFPPDIRLSWPEYGYSYRAQDVVDIYQGAALIPYQEIESDFSSLARTSLYNRGKSIAIKQVLRVGAKKSIAHEVGNENALAGGLLQIALFVLEEADTRGWDSLPSQMSMLRIPLDAGTHKIELKSNGHTLKTYPEVTIRKGKTEFRHFRIEPFIGGSKPVRELRQSPVTVEYRVEKEL